MALLCKEMDPEGAEDMWETFYNDGIAAIDWHMVDTGDLSQYESLEAIDALGLGRNDSLCMWEFSHSIIPGDVIFVKRGLHQIVGAGIVTGPYYYVDSDDYMKVRSDSKDTGNYRHRINVKWEVPVEIHVKETLPRKTLTRL